MPHFRTMPPETVGELRGKGLASFQAKFERGGATFD